MDKVTAKNLKNNLDEARKVWAAYPGECEGADIQFCAKCDHRMTTNAGGIECQFELAPLTLRGLPCPYLWIEIV